MKLFVFVGLLGYFGFCLRIKLIVWVLLVVIRVVSLFSFAFVLFDC